MTKYYEANPPYIVADADKVLCNGETMTGEGGRVTSPDTAYLDTFEEMTLAEAEAMLDTSEATEEDYIEALNTLGVDTNDQE